MCSYPMKESPKGLANETVKQCIRCALGAETWVGTTMVAPAEEPVTGPRGAVRRDRDDEKLKSMRASAYRDVSR